MRKIYLTNSQIALVDDADYVWLSRYAWQASFSAETNTYYALATIHYKRTSMARLILGLTDPHVKADHKNHKTLDNRRENLRPASDSQSAANRRKPKNNKSGFKGVSWSKKSNKWIAQLQFDHKHFYLGQFATREAAHEAYKQKALAVHKEFSMLG